jgi:YHS domain-containing protein
MNRVITIVLVAGALVAGCNTTKSYVGGMGPKLVVNKDRDGVALQGYDSVAYFTDAKPVPGSSKHRARWMGATYHFASVEHRDRFVTDPERYAPQYGGYCGYAASIDKLSPISPEYWQIVDGRLILQHNQRAWDLWNEDVGGNVVKADANWPGLVERNGSSEKVLLNTDEHGLALEGHDPVAYFTEGRPAKGSPEATAVYQGVTYHFASVANKDAFEREPAKYAPAFGGFCGYAASIERVSPVDPAIFQIIDGRLVLQHTQKAFDLFNQDAPENLARADLNWPALTERNGK